MPLSAFTRCKIGWVFFPNLDILMAKKRVLQSDLAAKTQTNFLYEESISGRASDDTFVVEESQDVTAIIDANKKQHNEIDRHQPHGNLSKVASIPLNIYFDLKKQGVVDDPKRFKRWLNDPDNRYFRTRGGRV